MTYSNCELCNAAVDSNSASPEFYNKKIYESDNFIIIPAKGQLVEAQIMIVSRLHYRSLAAMPEECIAECRELIRKCLSISDDLLVYEHGSIDEEKGPSCVDHTHVHLMPSMSRFLRILDPILPQAETVVNLEELATLKTVEFPYILSANSSGEVVLYQAYNSHSQMMRKAIATALGLTEWDWRKASNDSAIKTYQNWHKHLNP